MTVFFLKEPLTAACGKNQVANDPFRLGWFLELLKRRPSQSGQFLILPRSWKHESGFDFHPEQNKENRFICRKDALSNFVILHTFNLLALAKTSTKHHQ